MSALQVKLRGALAPGADCSALLAGGWSGLSAADLARRTVSLPAGGVVALGDLAEVTGAPDGSICF
ncbi:MAG TPA: hypothetical protein VFP28_07105, partial [Gemmatimonadales bacterium]|nr:hypothetical protein [Gemmatimonadales bacterium]